MYFALTTTGAVEQSFRTMKRFLRAYQDTHPEFEFELNNLDWNDAWHHLVRTSIDKTGAGISEVGAPWVSDFVAMNSLRPFTPAEVEAVGGASAFFPVPWSNVLIPASDARQAIPQVYALPALVDVRAIYYWKDMLEDAGVDPATAFTTPQQLEHTLECLRGNGIHPACKNPWIYQTHSTRNWVYNMASWIWYYGGDFVDENGMPIFDQPAAIDGITAYIRLYRFLAPKESSEYVEKVFSERRTAVMLMSMYYHIHLMRGEDPYASKDLMPLLGCAQLPGPAFVGGTSFVIWEHASERVIHTAIDLLTDFMTSPYLSEYSYETHMLPSRLDAYTYPDLVADPFLPVFRRALETGRSHHSARRWMLICDGLSATCKTISRELQQDPRLEVRGVVERHIQALANRLNMVFSAT